MNIIWITGEKSRRLLTSLFCYGIVVSSIANGAPFFLRRVGFIDYNRYIDDLVQYCKQPIYRFWIHGSCHYRRIINNNPLEWITIDIARLYSLNLVDIGLKTLKYSFLLSTVIASIILVYYGGLKRPKGVQLLPVIPFLISTIISLGIGIFRQGVFLTFQGSLSLGWVPIMLFGSWLTTTKQIQKGADAVIILILCQIPLSILEAMLGLPVPFGKSYNTLYHSTLLIPSRLVQSFNQPNTLGIFLIVGLGYCVTYSQKKWLMPILFITIVPLLILARSGTGLLVIIIMITITSIEIKSFRSFITFKYIFFLVGIVFLVFLILPMLVGRQDLYVSLYSRWTIFYNLLISNTSEELIFGKGLGIAGNIHYLASEANYPYKYIVESMNTDIIFLKSDSMLSLLQGRSGILGIFSFYGLLIWAMYQDPDCIPFIGSVLICSLTINIIEVFPLNILLSLCLNRCLLIKRKE